MVLSNPSKQVFFESLGYKPHEGQIALHNLIDDYQVVTAVCGRRFGKTYASIYEAAYQVMQEGDASGAPVVYIVSDTTDHAGKIFQPLVNLFENNPVLKRFTKSILRKERAIELKNGAKIYAKTAENPSSLAGDNVSFAVIDEAGYVNDEAMRILDPAFAARSNPKRVNVGTPDRNDTFFKREFDLGQDEENALYASITLPSTSNPLVKVGYLKAQEDSMSSDDYQRFYLAEFSTVDGNPFSGLLEKLEYVETPQDAQPGRTYVAGVDLADRRDFTAVVILDVTNQPARLVRVERWNGIGYEATCLRAAEILRPYRARAYVDRTGVGDAVYPMLAKEYGNVSPVVFSMPEKQKLFDAIYSALEKGKLRLYQDKVLMSELRNLQAVQKQRGVSYQAPRGLKDDCVMALFLAGKGLSNRITLPQGFRLGGYMRAV